MWPVDSTSAVFAHVLFRLKNSDVTGEVRNFSMFLTFDFWGKMKSCSGCAVWRLCKYVCNFWAVFLGTQPSPIRPTSLTSRVWARSLHPSNEPSFQWEWTRDGLAPNQVKNLLWLSIIAWKYGWHTTSLRNVFRVEGLSPLSIFYFSHLRQIGYQELR